MPDISKVLWPQDVRTLPRFSQSQASLSDQLALLQNVAVQMGLYDAADFIARSK